jgi:sulfotransferase
VPEIFHFISGLPRSGSTLLLAILRQNPRIRAAMTSLVGSLFTSLHNAMGQSNEFSEFIDERQRQRVLRGIFDLHYQDHAQEVILDTNQRWCARLPPIRRKRASKTIREIRASAVGIFW